jgi:hypothetical protein
MKLRNYWAAFILLCVLATLPQAARGGPWSVERAKFWYREVPWPVGCNFTPSTAINQLEMWQADTFDIRTIDRELAMAQRLGFNCVRVFLHNIPWEQDRKGFFKRVDRFLSVADRNRIKVMFVLLDSCWDPNPKAGKQRAPTPGLHNSGWVQCPGVEILKDPARHGEMGPYVRSVVGHFRNDRRILVWDLFNEPDNMNRPAYVSLEPQDKPKFAFELLKKAFEWARQSNPSQPLTTGVWVGAWGNPEQFTPMEKFIFAESDVISFHNYGSAEDLAICVKNLQRFKRPIFCTEYMARPAGSTFDPILAFLKQEKVGALNWGFVAGKTQTIYPWDSWQKPYDAEPAVWFHDILRADGTAYDPKEVDYIRSLTRKQAMPQSSTNAPAARSR